MSNDEFRLGDSLKKAFEALQKAVEPYRLEMAEWPDLSDSELVEIGAGNMWRHYAGLLEEDRANWTILEAHERWLDTQAQRARERAPEEQSEALRKRMYLFANIYEMKRRTLLRLMHRYMATNTLPSWEKEKASIENDYAALVAFGFLTQNEREKAARRASIHQEYWERADSGEDKTSVRDDLIERYPMSDSTFENIIYPRDRPQDI